MKAFFKGDDLRGFNSALQNKNYRDVQDPPPPIAIATFAWASFFCPALASSFRYLDSTVAAADSRSINPFIDIGIVVVISVSVSVFAPISNSAAKLPEYVRRQDAAYDCEFDV